MRIRRSGIIFRFWKKKAYRLKTLTEDVVEASKVSSGNISLEMMNLNLVELVNQTSAEFEEKFEARNLKMIMNLPTEPATIYADGRRMWRVLANVFNNAAKYAMEGSPGSTWIWFRQVRKYSLRSRMYQSSR